MKLIGNKGHIYVGPHNLEVHRDIPEEYVFEAPLSELPKWIKELEITSTEDGGIRMGTW